MRVILPANSAANGKNHPGAHPFDDNPPPFDDDGTPFPDIPLGPIGKQPEGGRGVPGQSARGGGAGKNAQGGGGSGIASGSTDTSGSTGSTGGTTTASAFSINVIWDASVQSAPSGFVAGIMNAVHYLESQFTDPVTINIKVGYGEVAGSAMANSNLGSSRWSMVGYNYSQIAHALAADATTALDASAVASLVAISPIPNYVAVTTAQAKALGLIAANSATIDGSIGFSSKYAFTYDNSGGVKAGTFDFEGIVLHEMTEVMGRDLLTSSTTPSLYQLFHYSAPGVLDFSSSTPGYFSVDGGRTPLAAFNTKSGGDAGDWSSTVKADALDAFVSAGIVNAFSGPDVAALDAIGWNANPYMPPAPNGINMAAATNLLAKATGSAGLKANAALIAVSETGGVVADSYSYTLGGTDAASFALAVVSGGEKLVAGAAGVPGAVNGKLYSLTASATDSSGAGSSPMTKPLNVIVGTGGADVVQAGLLAASVDRSAPTFIYGLGGGDILDGTGMNGPLWLASGPGADVLTGGSGVNHFWYGTITGSTPASMDVITNFDTSKDLIDLSGISKALKYAGSLSDTIAAGSIGWQASGGQATVYVNNSSASASLGAANMAIALQGVSSMASKNFVL